MLSKLRSLKWPGSNTPEAGAIKKTASPGKSDNSSGDKRGGEKPSPEQDAKAAKSLNDARATLKDPSDKKRLAAINNIDDIELLQSTALHDDSEAVRDSAAKKYARLLGSGDATKTLVSSYSSGSDTRKLAIAITAHHKDAEIRAYGSSLFNDEDDLCAIALETSFHDTRQAVTQRLTSIESIDTCWRGLKSKDKAVARILKARLDEERDAELLKQHQTETTRRIIDEMERLATGTWSPNYTTRFELFDQQWQQLSFQPAADDVEKYQSFRHIAADKVSANKERQQKHDQCQAITDEIAQLSDDLANSGVDTLVEKYEASHRSFNNCLQRWQNTDKDFSGFKNIEQSFDQSSRALKVQLQQASAVVNAINALNPKTHANKTAAVKSHADNSDSITPAALADASASDITGTGTDITGDNTRINNNSNKENGAGTSRSRDDRKTPDLEQVTKKLSALNDRVKQEDKKTAYAPELPQLLSRLNKEVVEQRESRAALQNAIGRQFASLNSALASKRWGPARSIHERLSNKINRLTTAEQTRYLEKLARLEVKLNELGDWKQFATEPKLISLCEQMEKIPQQELAPRDQADRIKALQQQWKSMGASPALEEYWPRFKAAADTAYEPCAKYFAAKREEKNSKLKHRRDVCKMLEDYLEKSDWQNPEWKLVEKTLRTAKAEWRNTRVFDRKATAELDQRFTTIVDALNEKLGPAYDAGAAEKADLIEKVQVLAEGDINQHCINQVKRLQGLWRRTGITRQKDDKKLWSQFNQHCSDIFSRHRGQQQEQYAASIQHVTRGREIIRELKEMAKSSTVADDKAIQQLQDEFQALPDFPEKDSKYLMRDFGRAIEGIEAQIQNIGENSRTAELARIARNAEICSMLEKLIDLPTEQAMAESERLLDNWDDGEKTDSSRWKKSMKQRRDSIVKHLQSNTKPDYHENTLHRRLLCIEAEILKDTATPASDRDLRMQHQLNKLQSGDRGNINHSPVEEATNLRVAWLTAPPADPADSAALEQRFNTALST